MARELVTILIRRVLTTGLSHINVGARRVLILVDGEDDEIYLVYGRLEELLSFVVFWFWKVEGRGPQRRASTLAS